MFNLNIYKEDAQQVVKVLYYPACLTLPRKLAKAQQVINWQRPEAMKKIDGRKRWTAAEDQCSLAHSPSEAMQQLGRSSKSISLRLWRQRKEHYKEVTNQNRRQRIAEWKKYLAELKSQPCKDCRKIYPAVCLDFDHLEFESKVAAIPVMISYKASRERILAELAKTEVVCANCHRAREHARYLQSGKPPGHLSPRQRRNPEPRLKT